MAEKSAPPLLTRRTLSARMRHKCPVFPKELTEAAREEIIKALAGALSSGRPIVLRGFGRLELRRYRASAKRLGVIFRPGRALLERLNKPK